MSASEALVETEYIDSDAETAASAERGFDRASAEYALDGFLVLAQMWAVTLPNHSYTEVLLNEVNEFLLTAVG